MQDQFHNHEVSFTRTSHSNSCTSGKIPQETEVSSANPDFKLAANPECSKRKVPETYQADGNNCKRLKFDENLKDFLHDHSHSTEYDNEVSELDFLTAKIDVDTLYGQSHEYDQAALEKIQIFFPNTDPDFIKDNMTDKGVSMTVLCF